MKKPLAIFLCVIMIAAAFAGCKQTADVNATAQPASSTTTTTTTTRTTEDLSTTFKEAQTNEIYPALYKDSEGGYSYKLASYTTYYDKSNKTRTTNISNAVRKLNGIVIPKDAVFSFNQTVGKRTVTAGYEQAKIVQGDEFVDGLGGGICQVSSTVFQAALRSNMKILVRAAHSLEISYVPLGADATVQWNTQDFQFKNNTSSDIKMVVKASNGTLVCTLYSKSKVNTGNVKINVSKSGSEYVLTRTVDGKQNYSTYSTYKKAKTSTTTKKAAKTTTKKR